MVILMATNEGRPILALPVNPHHPFFRLPLWVAVLLLGLLLLAYPAPAAEGPPQPFFKVESVVVPVQLGLQRDAANIGFARSGETFPALSSYKGWAHIQFSPDLTGWVPEASGRYIPSNGSIVPILPILFGGFLGLLIGGFITLALIRWRQNRRTSRELASLLQQAQSRRGKRILAILPSWPEVSQVLDGDTRPMPNLLREWGYSLSHITSTEEVLSQARQFQPNILMALSKDARRLEEILSQDATLANTPVVYLGEKPPRLTEGNGIRLHWMLAGNDKALSETLTMALRRSPKTIRHGVRSEGIRGELDGGGLWEVLHFLAVLRKTGKLQIETANLNGEIRLLKGDILFARMGDLSDAEAVSGLLNLDEGKFAFFESKAAQQGKGMNTEKLLLDWAKQRDEIHDGPGT
jgi:Domain of unknown function (DUF4388)